MSASASRLPHLAGLPTVTDGGLETDLIFNHGLDLPGFAAFPLLDTESGRQLLTEYYDGYAAIAEYAGAALLLEAPTWCAHSARAEPLGYGAEDLNRLNMAAIGFLKVLREKYLPLVRKIAVIGMIGPRGDGYGTSGAIDPAAAKAYHLAQLASFAAAGADGASALTLPEPGEAIGIVQGAREVGLPIGISFTLETNGRLHSGMTLGEAITMVQETAPPDWFMVNCAHPSHIEPALAGSGEWVNLIRGLRCNASRQSHEELDQAEILDPGKPEGFGDEHLAIRELLPSLNLLGGCCGTDHRHVASIWGVAVPELPSGPNLT